MPRITAEQLIAQFSEDTHALTHLLATQRLQPYLGLELTIHQLKIVLLVATGAATSGRELAERLHVSAPSVSASVEKLVELGYLSREESGPDRRIKRLAPTATTQRLYELFLSRREASDELLAELDSDDLAALVRGTAALRRAVEAHLPRAAEA